jgi:hypothetical protein
MNPPAPGVYMNFGVARWSRGKHERPSFGLTSLQSHRERKAPGMNINDATPTVLCDEKGHAIVSERRSAQKQWNQCASLPVSLAGCS